MPIIPRVDESQVLSAGSPVPVSGTSEDRMLYKEFSDLGQTMVSVGQQLGNISKATQKEIAKINADIAGNDFATDLAKLRYQAENESITSGGKLGFPVGPEKRVDIFNTRAKALVEKYAAQFDNSPEEKLYFLKDATNKVSAEALSYFAASVKQETDRFSDVLDMYTTRLASNIVSDPSPSSLDKAMTEYSTKIAEVKIFSDDEKRNLGIKAAKQFARSMVDGFLLKMDRSKSAYEIDRYADTALSLLASDKKVKAGEEDSYKIALYTLTPDEMGKAREDIVSTMYKAKQRLLLAESRQEKMDLAEIERAQKRRFQNMTTRIAGNVTDKTTADIADSDIDYYLAINELNPTQAASLRKLINTSMYRPPAKDYKVDSLYTDKFVEDIVSKGNHNDDDFSIEDAASRNVSAKTMAVLKSGSAKIDAATKKDPTIIPKLKNATDRLKKTMELSGVKNLSREKQMELQDKVYDAVSKLNRSFVENPALDSETFAKAVYSSNIEQFLVENKILTLGNSSYVDARIAQIAAEMKKKGTLSPAENKRYVDELLKLKAQKENLGREK